ncbi:hypothetical protein D1007_32214 [Hordeum vulgare]|nr:hypothetical protein D1007_32214 [Hordeum vulgare]
MFQSLERRASRALGDICEEGVSGPLIPDDSGYLRFFCHVVESLEASVGKALAFMEEKSCGLLGRYIIMPSDMYAYWGIAPPQVPVPELPVEYQTPVYQWEPEDLTQQWNPQYTPEFPEDS